MAGTVFTPSLEGMKHVKLDNGIMLTKPFLDVCKLVLPVLGMCFALLFFLPQANFDLNHDFFFFFFEEIVFLSINMQS